MPLPSGQAAGWWTAFEGWCGRQAGLANNSYEVAKFLLNESGRGLGDTAQTISDWLGGDENSLAAFNAIAFGASRGLVDGIRGLVWSSGALLANNSYEVAKFLLNESGRGLGDTAQTISDWLGGNKALAAFNAIAFGASRGLVDGIRGLVWSSGPAGKQLFRSGQVSAQRVGPRAGRHRRTISDWLGGDRVAAFWAIVHPDAADRSYADGIRGLIGARLLSNSYGAVLEFLLSQLDYATAMGVIDELF